MGSYIVSVLFMPYYPKKKGDRLLFLYELLKKGVEKRGQATFSTRKRTALGSGLIMGNVR